MKVFTFYNSRFFIIVCLFLGITMVSNANINHDSPSNTIDCSSFSQPEYFACRSDFPDIHPDFRDFTTNGNGDLNSYASIGGIIDNCVNLIVTAQDFNFPPSDCSDSLRVQRVYRFSDGFTIIGECTRTFVTFELPISLVSLAENKIVSCTENVDSLFTDWLDNFAGSEIFECMNPATVTRLPAVPVIFYGACRQVDTLSNIISGDIRVQWNFEDDCGTIVSTIASFFIIDTVAPVILCPPDMTFDISDNNLLTDIQSTLNQVSAIEDCDEFRIDNNFVSDSIQFNCDLSQEISVVFTAVDSCQNMSTCSSNLIIINDNDPEITCPSNIELECNDLNNFDLATAWITTSIGEDNVGNPITANSNFDISSLNSISCIEETVITFNVTDNCGRSASCTSTIIINDNLAPDISCPANFVSSYSSSTLTEDLDSYFNLFTSNDICNSFQPLLNLSDPDLSFNCEDKDVLVTYTATDECGNSSSCQSNISITNDYDSNINCGDTLTLFCGDLDNLTLLQNWINTFEGSDNLGNNLTVMNDIDITVDSILECHGLLQVNFTMIDLCGDVKSCDQVFEVLDTIAPIISCPLDLTIQSSPATLDQEIQAWLEDYNASDNCTAIDVISNYDNNLFVGCDLSISNEITFTVSDNCGLQSSCVSNLTIETDRFPTVICPLQLNVECGDINNEMSINSWLLNTLGTDFSGNDLTVNNDYVASNLNLIQCNGILEIAFSVVDNCNFTDTCRTSIVLEDTTSPEITCPLEITINTTSQDINETITNWLLDYTTNDICLGSTVTNDLDITALDLCNPNLVNVITFTAEDDCGLISSCQSTITFNDEDPTVSCPSSLDLECGDPNNTLLIMTWIDEATGLDNNNSNLTVTNDFDASLINVGCSESYMISFNTEDNCLKSNNCTSIITIEDTSIPEIDCPMDLNLLSGDPNKESKYDDYINNIIIDDCNSYSISSDLDLSLLGFSCDDQLLLPFTFVATDACGASSSCELTIIISNNVVANIVCPTNLTLNCGDVINQDTIAQWLQETLAEDNTGNNFPVDNDFDFNNSLLLDCQSSIPVLFEMVDLCNSAVTCMSNVIIEDTEIPTINCPIDTFFIFEDSDFDSNVNTWINTATGNDNCTAVVFDNNYDSNNVLGNCEEEEIQNITFTVQDECGFTNDCSVNLTIRTSRTPVITCPSILTVECGENNNTNITNWLNTSNGLDADGNDLVVTDDFNQTGFDLLTCGDTLPVNFTISDNCNFMAACNSLIILEDTTPPSVVCNNALTVNSADINANDVIETWLNTFSANDNCSSVNSQNNFDLSLFDICDIANEYEVEFIASDECGMSNICQSTINIVKEIPEITCPQNLTLECGLSDSEIESTIQMFISQVEAIDNAGNTITGLSNDYISMSLVNACQSSIDITVIASDNCAQSNQCIVSVSIEDTTAPVLTCPNQLLIDVDDPNIQSQIDNWLESYSIVEACNIAVTTDDYAFEISTLECDTIIEVIFNSQDECENNSSCFSTITFANNNMVEITCPDDVSVSCATFSESQLSNFFNEFIIKSQDTFAVSNDYIPLSLDCANIETQVITFEAIDICGNMNDCTSNITYLPEASTYIPNTFSPNRDGDNDYFTVFSNEFVININSMAIYDRWGELIFLNENFPPNDESQGWNGRFRNDDAVQGVYIYVIKTEDNKGNIVEEVGQLNLLR